MSASVLQIMGEILGHIYKPIFIKEKLTTGNIRPQKQCSHQTECNRGHITHTHTQAAVICHMSYTYLPTQ